MRKLPRDKPTISGESPQRFPQYTMNITDYIDDSDIFIYALIALLAWYGMTNWIIAAMGILIIAEVLKITAKIIRKRKGGKQ